MWMEKAKDLGICLAFAVLVWIPLGRWIRARVLRFEHPGGNSTDAALGMAGWGLWVLSLGTAGLLYRSVLIASAAGILLLTIVDGGFGLRAPASASPPARGDRIALGVAGLVGFVFGVLVLASALAPEAAFDSLNVHLPYARDAALSHRLFFDSNNWSSAMPALPLMAYVTAFVFSGAALAKLFNALCYVLCAGVVFHFARRWWGARVGAGAALLFVSCPVALYEATTALVDLPLTLFSALAVCALLDWTLSGERGMLRLSAVSLGLAMGCKYHAAFWLAPFMATILFHSFFRRRDGARCAVLRVLRYLLIAFCLYLPWLFRTWYLTGNPVFPAANSLFRSPYFTPEMAAAASAAYANEGVGISLRALALLPWTLTFHPGPFRGTPGIVFLPALLLALARRMSQPVGYGLVITVCYF